MAVGSPISLCKTTKDLYKTVQNEQQSSQKAFKTQSIPKLLKILGKLKHKKLLLYGKNDRMYP